MNTFDSAHEAWFDAALRGLTRKARESLERGHGHGERRFLRDVWWPAVGSFEHLHPQYEVRDFEGNAIRIDFAYLRPPFRICIEVEENPCRSASEPRAERLAADYWIVLRFPLADVLQDPLRCRRTLTGAFDRMFRDETTDPSRLSPGEKDILRLAARSVRPTKPSDVMRALQVSDKTARALLKSLVDKRLLRPAGTGSKRIRAYEPALEPLLLLYMVG
ncbi:DNA-binding response regulator [Paenibacillus antri]|uniref:DNA-binding response regulator n=1 Tax=Paenibacillus antri TaxID=2582848 RepID=A0A5R9GFU0_9BACL|nr:DNA-binding response regulator [Paenibacillus antri]TLS53030.1 DNA-binding response regulator [Paenibacillus antri]